MEPDKLALLKVTAAVAVIIAFLVIWFLTVGAPADEEEEEETTESAVEGDVLVLGAPLCSAPEAAAAPCAGTVGTPFPSPALS